MSRSRYLCQIRIGIPVCVMSCEYFTRTSLYLVRLKVFKWIKFVRRHLHQIQANWVGRDFITASRENSRLITHARMRRKFFFLFGGLPGGGGIRCYDEITFQNFEPSTHFMIQLYKSAVLALAWCFVLSFRRYRNWYEPLHSRFQRSPPLTKRIEALGTRMEQWSHFKKGAIACATGV